MNSTHKKYNPDLQPMAPNRIRQIRPEFWTDDRIAELSITARLLFIGLWHCSDKNGNCEWRPKALKARIFPFDDIDINPLLAELLTHGDVRQYCIDGREYGQIVRWTHFQYLSKTEYQADAVYPEPPQDPGSQNVSKRSETFSTLGVGVGVGKSKRKVKEKGVGVGVGASHAHKGDASPITAASNSKPNVKDNPFSFDSPDVTLPDKNQQPKATGKENQTHCVRDIPTDSSKAMYFSLSDGLLEEGALQEYGGGWSDAGFACMHSIEKFGDSLLIDRRALAMVLNDVMDTMKREGKRYPKGFLKVKKILEKGGVLQTSQFLNQPEPPAAYGDVFASPSIFRESSEWIADLSPYKELLQKVVDGKAEALKYTQHIYNGVPQIWQQGVDLLNAAIEELQYHNEPVPCVFENIRDEMQTRVPPSL